VIGLTLSLDEAEPTRGTCGTLIFFSKSDLCGGLALSKFRRSGYQAGDISIPSSRYHYSTVTGTYTSDSEIFSLVAGYGVRRNERERKEATVRYSKDDHGFFIRVMRNRRKAKVRCNEDDHDHFFRQERARESHSAIQSR
jgi:hypothetical protein